MTRPKAKELTERELEIMHVFWNAPEHEPTTVEVRDTLADQGRDLAITTVATLLSILVRKKFLKQTGATRPHGYRALRSKEDVSGSILGDLLQRVFGDSPAALIKCLMEQTNLSRKDRAKLQRLLNEPD